AMPRSRNRRVDCSELETAPSMSWRRSASASMKCATVEPVPTPTTMPGSTYRIAARPACRFNSSALIRGSWSWAFVGLCSFEREDEVPLRLADRHDRQAVATLQQREAFQPRFGLELGQADRTRELAPERD